MDREIFVLAEGSDSSIGGRTFTKNIKKYVLQRYRERHGGEEYDSNHLKAIFEKINIHVLANIQKILKDFLKKSVSDIKDIGQVILVGGARRMSAIEKRIQKNLPSSNIRKTMDVETVVAVGAIKQIIVYIWQIYYIAVLCSQLDQEVKGIQFFLHRIELRGLPMYLQTKIGILVVRLATDPLAISPWQFFRLDRRLLTTMFASMTTYLIILIQFQISDKNAS
ncbi:unnamed protein product [Allacma fusca]|uniref:Heat shock protein 70 n=1 Tax=Allacma fusca TaxID=39272 RepID=A0A8J2NSG3_9HEXA|nr:unnamed protein product [Allacma fusca]